VAAGRSEASAAEATKRRPRGPLRTSGALEPDLRFGVQQEDDERASRTMEAAVLGVHQPRPWLAGAIFGILATPSRLLHRLSLLCVRISPDPAPGSNAIDSPSGKVPDGDDGA
jgi:hypothetical protein